MYLKIQFNWKQCQSRRKKLRKILTKIPNVFRSQKSQLQVYLIEINLDCTGKWREEPGEKTILQR